MSLIIPKHYTPKLLPETTEQAIKGLKDSFQRALAKNLNLRGTSRKIPHKMHG